MFNISEATSQAGRFRDPQFVRALFSDVRLAWLWVPFRVWLGYTWFMDGWGKVTGSGWMDGGTSLLGFWQRAVVVEPKAVITFDWYRAFIQFMIDTEAYTWFAKLIAVGEVAVGVALILGAFTGIAAFGGSFMNGNYVM